MMKKEQRSFEELIEEVKKMPSKDQQLVKDTIAIYLTYLSQEGPCPPGTH